MAVIHEIKSQLAKLLAMEDLVVEHKQVETAQFNVQTRVLTLPLWQRASNNVYDLLVGHEVGHALFTPDQDPPKDIPHSFINIVEDARIEKLMRKKYPGLNKSFNNGYAELAEKDFFCLEGEDVSEMNLADRANLYFKIGNCIDIPFYNFVESVIIKTISDCETFNDVIVASRELYEYCKKPKTEENVQVSIPAGSQENSSGPTESDQKESVDDETHPEESESQNSNGIEVDSASSNKEPEVRTVENLQENLKSLTSDFACSSVYVEIPDLDMDTVIATNGEIHSMIDNFFQFLQKHQDTKSLTEDVKTFDLYENVDVNFRKFKKAAQREVGYLVKEFECKKAADSYSRSSVSRTGVLDCTKLHTYKYNEDLFKRVTVLPEGKNHGLVFVLDWSGSMSNVLLDTLKQLYNLIWFCKKVSIPFDVYAFTNDWNRTSWDPESKRYIHADLKPHYEKNIGLLSVDSDFNMMNILTSDVNSKDLEKQMINIWRIASYYGERSVAYHIPEKMQLSGTPLNEALISLHKILPEFRQKYKLQKVQCIVLSDGEAGQLPYHTKISRNDDSWIGTRHINNYNSYLRDRKTGNTYSLGLTFYSYTDALIRNLRDKFNIVNFIGIRVLAPRDAMNFIKCYYEYGNEDYDSICHEWRKQKSFTIKNSGYHAYFGMSATTLSTDTEFDVKEGATKSQIKNAFIKSLTGKKLNKKMLGDFIALVV